MDETEKQNIVGPQIRKLRYQKEMTQETLAARCGVRGLDISRGTLAKIEAQLRKVSDIEALAIAKALSADIRSLFSPRS